MARMRRRMKTIWGCRLQHSSLRWRGRNWRNGSVGDHDPLVFVSLGLWRGLANCLTNTQCGTSARMSSIILTYPDCFDTVIFMSCKPPVDPVKLMMKHVETFKKRASREQSKSHPSYSSFVLTAWQIHASTDTSLWHMRCESSRTPPYVVEPLLRIVPKRIPKGLRRLARHVFR